MGTGDDNGDDTVGNDIDVDTDNTDDIGETDDNNADDNDDGTDDDDLFATFETTSFETTDDSIDDTDDSMETTGATQDTDSGSDDSGDDSDDSMDADSDEDVDLCIGLQQLDCSTLVEDDGDAECAFNTVTDDGYNAAITQADDEQQQLELLVAVLGAFVGILTLVVLGGAFYLYKKTNGKANHQQLDQTVHADDDGDRLIAGTA